MAWLEVQEFLGMGRAVGSLGDLAGLLEVGRWRWPGGRGWAGGAGGALGGSWSRRFAGLVGDRFPAQRQNEDCPLGGQAPPLSVDLVWGLSEQGGF